MNTEQKKLVCSRKSIRDFTQKQKKSVVIVTRPDHRNSSDLVNVAKHLVTEDTVVSEIRTDDQSDECDALVRELDVGKTPVVLIFERGELKKKISGSAVEEMSQEIQNPRKTAPDTLGDSGREDDEKCKAKFKAEDSWRLEPETSAQCIRAIQNAKHLPPYARKYLAKHMITDDPVLKNLVEELKTGGQHP